MAANRDLAIPHPAPGSTILPDLQDELAALNRVSENPLTMTAHGPLHYAGTATPSLTSGTLQDGTKVTIRPRIENDASADLEPDGLGPYPLFVGGGAIPLGYMRVNRSYTYEFDGTRFNYIGDMSAAMDGVLALGLAVGWSSGQASVVGGIGIDGRSYAPGIVMPSEPVEANFKIGIGVDGYQQIFLNHPDQHRTPVDVQITFAPGGISHFETRKLPGSTPYKVRGIATANFVAGVFHFGWDAADYPMAEVSLDSILRYIIVYGQSLSQGTIPNAGAGPSDVKLAYPFNTVPPDPTGLLQFSDDATDPLPGGPSPNNASTSDVGTAVYDFLIPCREQAHGASMSLSETACTTVGIAYRHIAKRKSSKVVVGAFGCGGETIDQLDKRSWSSGTPSLSESNEYKNVRQSMAGLVARASGLSLTPRVDYVVWEHGHADRDDADANYTYEAALVQLLADLDADAHSATSQTANTVRMLASQLAQTQDLITEIGKPAYSILHASNNNARICCVGPSYFVERDQTTPYVGHLTSYGYAVLWGLYAKFLIRWEQTGTKPLPLQATAATRSGAIITLTFNPVGKLVWTPLFKAQNRGFAANAASGGAALDISAVGINSATQVQITLASDPGAQVDVGIARFGADANSSGFANSGPVCELMDTDDFCHPTMGVVLPNYACHQIITTAT